MKKKKQFLTAMNALQLELPTDIVDDLKYMAHAALDEEYQRGIDDGKVIQEHGTVNWIT